MAEKIRYRTRQFNEMCEFLAETEGKHFTAGDVKQFFEAHGSSIGTATVYRRLDAMIDEGIVKKYFIDENSSACYEYIGKGACPHPVHYHLKCERCGRLFHLDCEEVTNLEEHILGHHNFRIDPARTVFYGICSDCEEKDRDL